MDGIPVQIVEILKVEGSKKSNYKLNSEALSKILSQVNDKKVAVISIVGKSRRGKSFLLSYLIKYLSDSTNVNWVPNTDEPLLGFEWKNTIDPVTKGIWMWSKPIIVQQSAGGDLAILLMDSQGVYDEDTDLRDWSTIVGITLLTSSIFIFNIFTDIQENNLTDLESFLNYGQMAIENEQTDEQLKPFQKLLFLVRDWNFSQEIKHGLSGGKKYIAKKLSIKNTQSEKSKRTRKLINECFEEVSCYLMPKHILNEEQEFNGSVSQLNPEFVKKMKELFSLFFDPESLEVKVISGLQITGRDLLTYFEDYIEIFNSDKLDPSLLLEVTAKATDFKIIFDLKMKYIRDMEEKINSKKFLSKVEFMNSESEIKKEINQSFVSQIKSKNKLLVEQLRQFLDAELKTEYLIFHNKNEKRRENTANDTIEMCINFHKERIDNYFEEKIFSKTFEFDQIMAETKNLAINKFNEIFQEENAESVAHYLLKILKTIGENEVSFRAENQNRKSDSKKQNKETVDKSLGFYCERIKTMIDQNVFLIDENFNKLEEQTKAEALKIFSDNCTGNEIYKQKFLNSLNSQLEHKRTEFLSLNKNQMRATITKTELDMKTALNYYTEKMKNTLHSFCGNEDFNAINKNIKTKAFALFEGDRLLKDSNLWSQYSKKLDTDINQLFINFNKSFEEKMENLEQFYCETIDNAMDKNFLDENAFFNEQCLLSDDEAINLREDLLNDIKQHYENVPKEGKFEDIKIYINDETAKASDLILINKLIEIFKEQMKEQLLTKAFFLRKSFSELFDETKRDFIETFDANKKTKNSDELNSKLNEDFKKEFDTFYEQNEQNRETFIEGEIERCFTVYKETMTEILDKVCLEQNRFDETTEKSKSKAHEMLNKICGEENELKESYFSELRQLMETEEKELNLMNNKNLKEANKKNTESVKKCLSFYEKRMESVLKDNMILTEEAFRKHHNTIKEETFDLFSNTCNCGEPEFIETFEINLQQSIAKSKRKFKKMFSEEVVKFETRFDEEINNCLEYYKDVMLTLLDFIKIDEHKLKHKEFKSKAIKSLKSKLIIRDEEFMNKQIAKLDDKIENEFKENFLAKNKDTEERDEVETKKTDSVDKNIEQREYAEPPVDNLGTELNEDLYLNSLSQEVENRESQNLIEEDIREADEFAHVVEKSDESFVTNADEFEIIESSNESDDEYSRAELIDSSEKETDSSDSENEDSSDESDENKISEIRLKMTELIRDYEDKMSVMIEFLASEDDLKRNHNQILNDIKEDMISLNPFSNSAKFEPFLKELIEEIEKSFEDSHLVFRARYKKRTSVLKDLTKKAIKFYREEMDKYFENTNFLMREKLEEYNSLVILRTIDKFKDERQDVSPEIFENHLRDNLKVVFVEISEENLKNAPTLPAIGIDLGTTYSCVAYFRTGKPRGEVVVIPNDMGNRTTPSVVNFLPNNDVVVGEAANEQSYSNSSNFIYSAKRLIGRQFNDEKVQNDMKFWRFKVIDDGNNIAKIQVKPDENEKSFFPEEISAKILKKLKQTAENHLGCVVKNAVITVPAYFNDSQKEATKDAGRMAGLNVLKIINEPTAAALAFQLKRNDDLETKKVLIFDFGGGTLDIVVLVIERGVIDIKAVGGDNHLGGDDIDNNMAQYCLDEFRFKTNITFDQNTEEFEKALRRLTIECERKKRSLCGAQSVVINVDSFYKRKDLNIALKREKFEELNDPIFKKSMDLVEQVLTDAKLDHSAIDDIVLVGGTTRIPKIRKMLSDLFFGKTLNHSVNPDEAVAIGAAIQAAVLNGSLAHDHKFLRVSDVAPMSLGVEVKDGFMSVIVHRNSKVPEKYTKQYETTRDNQQEVEVKIYEGEENMVANNRLLGTFVVQNIPPGYAGEQKFEITFDINDEGILHVTAKLINSDEEHGIRITEHKARLSDKDITELMNNALI